MLKTTARRRRPKSRRRNASRDRLRKRAFSPITILSLSISLFLPKANMYSISVTSIARMKISNMVRWRCPWQHLGLRRSISRNSSARNLHQRAQAAADTWKEGREELAGFRGGSERDGVNEHFVFSVPIFCHAQLPNQTHYLLPAAATTAAACDACDPASRTRTRCNAGAFVRRPVIG